MAEEIKEQTEKNVDTELEQTTQEVTPVEETDAPKPKEKKARAVMLPDGDIMVDECRYRLVKNYRESFDIELFNDRYSDVLNRYEFIVGDMGFEQLRLKGFFANSQKKMPVEQRIGSLQDYLYEYCNFGCAYFILERLGVHPVQENNRSNRNKRNNKRNKPKQQGAHIQEKRGKADSFDKKGKPKAPIKNKRPYDSKKTGGKDTTQPKQTKPTSGSEKRNFTIRQKSE